MLHRFAGRFLSLFKGNEKAAVRGREKKIKGSTAYAVNVFG